MNKFDIISLIIQSYTAIETVLDNTKLSFNIQVLTRGKYHESQMG